MDGHYLCDFQVLETKYHPQNSIIYQPGYQNNGGFALMDRQQSSASSTSEVSYSSSNLLSNPPSPLGMMTAKYEYENNSLAPQQYGSFAAGPYFSTTESVKQTPSSLGWSHDTSLLKLYSFVVPKGKEPYLQLLQSYSPTPETPTVVYLDRKEDFKKSQHPCLYPGKCNGKQNVFNRPADLERHYKILHADFKESYPCDYSKCGRSRDPFTRKDHYRDHLRDFHQEDIGHPKGEKKLKAKDQRKWEQAQQTWLSNRRISSKYWRCAKCLIRNYVVHTGWTCSGSTCHVPCEDERKRARESMALEQLDSEDPSTDTRDENASYSGYPTCVTCNGDGWILQDAEWELCPACQPAVPLSYPTEYTGEESSHDWLSQ